MDQQHIGTTESGPPTRHSAIGVVCLVAIGLGVAAAFVACDSSGIVPPAPTVLFTDINRGVLHAAAEVGQDPAYAARSVTGKYRTTPLRGLAQHPPYFHDGSAATLLDVVEHYTSLFALNLTAAQQADLVAYLETL